MDAVNDCKELQERYDAISVLPDAIWGVTFWAQFVGADPPPFSELDFARDVRRRFGAGDLGREVYRRVATLCVSPNLHVDSALFHEFDTFAERPDLSPRSVVELLRWGRARGWDGQEVIAAELDRLDDEERADAAWEEFQQRIAERAAKIEGQVYMSTAHNAAPMPLLAGQQTVAALGADIVASYIASTDEPTPHAESIRLPLALVGHPLLVPLNDAIARAISDAEIDTIFFNADRALPTLGVLAAVHAETAARVVECIRRYGGPITDAAFAGAVAQFEAKVRRTLRIGEGWQRDVKGAPEANNSDNAAVFLAAVGVQLRWNAWAERAEITGPDIGPWCALDEARFSKLLVRAYDSDHKYRPSESLFRRALNDIAHTNMFDPAIDALAECERKYDGVPRLHTWLLRACGVPDDDYHRAVGCNIIGGIVRRIRHPGCKHDEVAILIGHQGCGKSTLARLLAMDDAWFSDSVAFDGTPQNVIPQLFGKAVIELAELDGMSKRDIEHVKRFLSTQSDHVTIKYAALASDFPRRCTFIGSTNENAPLGDITGNRRFLPVRIPGAIDLTWLRENVRKLIGEAAMLEREGADFTIPRDLWAQAAAQQEAARTVSPVEELLTEWFDRPKISAGYYVTSSDLTQALTMARQNGNAKTNTIMERLGYRRERMTPLEIGRRVRVWTNAVTNNPAEGTRRTPALKQSGRVELTAQAGSTGPHAPQSSALPSLPPR